MMCGDFTSPCKEIPLVVKFCACSLISNVKCCMLNATHNWPLSREWGSSIVLNKLPCHIRTVSNCVDVVLGAGWEGVGGRFYLSRLEDLEQGWVPDLKGRFPWIPRSHWQWIPPASWTSRIIAWSSHSGFSRHGWWYSWHVWGHIKLLQWIGITALHAL